MFWLLYSFTMYKITKLLTLKYRCEGSFCIGSGACSTGRKLFYKSEISLKSLSSNPKSCLESRQASQVKFQGRHFKFKPLSSLFNNGAVIYYMIDCIAQDYLLLFIMQLQMLNKVLSCSIAICHSWLPRFAYLILSFVN